MGESIGFEYDGGEVLFSQLSFNLQNKKYGLVGNNGVGKTTLSLIMAGKIDPSWGSLQRSGPITYLSQFEIPEDRSVAEYLADIWEISADKQIMAQRLLAGISLERKLPSLSGGEWMRVRLAKCLGEMGSLLILDEPTNNLDFAAQSLVWNFIESLTMPLIVISHDRRILNQMDEIMELSSHGLQSYGGNFDFYISKRREEADRQAHNLNRSRLELKAQERSRIKELQKQSKRTQRAEAKVDKMGLPKILAGRRKRQAHETAGRIDVKQKNLVKERFSEFKDALGKKKEDQLLYFELPETEIGTERLIFSCENLNIRFPNAQEKLWKCDLNLIFRGPTRISLKGQNGAGKTTLLKIISNQFQDKSANIFGECRRGTVVGAFIDQSLQILNFEKTVMENVYETSRFNIVETRNHLARFLFMGEQVHQKVASLSGGEKLKAALAKALLQNPVPQLLILDEPTNNLDLSSVEFIERVLGNYKGAILVTSHDEKFLEKIACTQSWVLSME